MQKEVAVIGGGISGMVAAYEAKKLGVKNVRLYEKTNRLGGALKTTTLGGVQVEEGADAFLARVPEGIELCKELEIEEHELFSPTTAKVLLLGSEGFYELIQPQVLGVPLDPNSEMSEEIRNELLIDLEREEIQADNRKPNEKTVGGFVRSRIGNLIYERQVAPLLSAISASNPDLLDLDVTTPIFSNLKNSPSLIKGLQNTAVTANTKKSAPVFYAPKKGMSEIVEGLSKKLYEELNSVELETSIQSLSEIPADAHILAIPAFSVAKLLANSNIDSETSKDMLLEIEFASVGMVQLVYKAQNSKDILPERFKGASGALVLAEKNLNITAVSFSSQKWGKASDSEVLRVSVGKHNADAIVEKSDEEILKIVLGELAKEFQIEATPKASRITRWRKSFPQYFPGHTQKLEVIKDALKKQNIFLAGSSLNGVGIPACIRSGREAALALLS